MGKSAGKARKTIGSSVKVGDALGGSTAKLKKKIRDIERLLKKDTLSADVRVVNERALKTLKNELKGSELNLKAKKLSKRYHMVRFFERKKAIRRLKQAKKNLELAAKEKDDTKVKELEELVKKYEVDLVYVVTFPKTEKYVSLYPNSEEPETADDPKVAKGLQKTKTKRTQYREHCEKLLEEGKLSFDIDEVLKEKRVNISVQQKVSSNEEIDAPEKHEEEEEDDFFEA